MPPTSGRVSYVMTPSTSSGPVLFCEETGQSISASAPNNVWVSGFTWSRSRFVAVGLQPGLGYGITVEA